MDGGSSPLLPLTAAAAAAVRYLKTKPGNNDGGQLGYEDMVHRGRRATDMGDNLEVVDLGREQKAIAIATGHYHSCALLATGNIKCWGELVRCCWNRHRRCSLACTDRRARGCLRFFSDGRLSTVSSMEETVALLPLSVTTEFQRPRSSKKRRGSGGVNHGRVGVDTHVYTQCIFMSDVSRSADRCRSCV